MTEKALHLYRRSATEDELEATIREAVALRGGRCWHVRDSRGLDVEDMPDLLIVCPPVLALIELKSQRRNVTAGQAHVLELVWQCNVIVSGIVRPVPRSGEMSLDQLLAMLDGA